VAKGELLITSEGDKDCNCCFKCFDDTEVKSIRVGVMVIKLCSVCFDKLASEVNKVKDVEDRKKNVDKWTKSRRYNIG